MNISKIKQEIIKAKSKEELLKQQSEMDKAKSDLSAIAFLSDTLCKLFFDFLADESDCKCNQKVMWELSAKDNAAIHLIEMYRSRIKEFDVREKKKLRDAKMREKLPTVSVRLYGKLIEKKKLKSDSSKEKNIYHSIPSDTVVFGKDKNNKDKCFKELASEAFNAIAKDFDAVGYLIDINKMIGSGCSYSELFLLLKNHLNKKKEG